MKVDRNHVIGGTCNEYDRYGQLAAVGNGIPLRLEIASRFVAASIASGISVVRERLGKSGGCMEISVAMLDLADALIEAHNATCGENSSGE